MPDRERAQIDCFTSANARARKVGVADGLFLFISVYTRQIYISIYITSDEAAFVRVCVRLMCRYNRHAHTTPYYITRRISTPILDGDVSAYICATLTQRAAYIYTRRLSKRSAPGKSINYPSLSPSRYCIYARSAQFFLVRTQTFPIYEAFHVNPPSAKFLARV